jgi:peptide deformylase
VAKLKIYTFPDLVLTKTAQPIARVEKQLHKLADDMLETMYDAPGIGLAANQVGILERVLVLDTEYDYEEIEGEDAPVLTNRKPEIIINPKIIHREGSILFSEGCLSVPEFSAEVKRAEKVKVEYQDINGLTQILSAEGLQAVAIQHEIDHLDGKLFIDRLAPLKKELAKKRLRKERQEREEDDSLEALLHSRRKPKHKGI